MSRDTRELCPELRHLRPLQCVSPGQHPERVISLIKQVSFDEGRATHGHSGRKLRFTASFV